jgi:hypothetical protein
MPQSAANKQILPFWKFMIFMIATAGSYQLYWFYSAWEFLGKLGYDKAAAKSSNCLVRTIGCLVPVVNLFLTWKLFALIQTVGQDHDLPKRYSAKHLFLLYNGLCLTDALIALLDIAHASSGTQNDIVIIARVFALILAPLYFLFLPQSIINDYLKQADAAQPQVDAKFSAAGFATILLAVCMWWLIGICAYGTFTMVPAATSDEERRSVVTTGKEKESTGKIPSSELNPSQANLESDSQHKPGALPTDAATDANKEYEEQAAKLNNEGVIALNKNDFLGAIQKLKLSLKAKPNYAFAQKNLSIAYNNYALLLPPEQAVIYFDKSLQCDPGNTTTLANLKSLQEGMQRARKQALH